ncbi:3-beta hydroxysteroid dehydrogenase/isomerase family-domain-containing protein [Jimgerdemannia flammicorona]|uniref:3-beta hydroxysteroid dehydrogenase/isomerase family-domain-containing protein n=1 Tax=Jimgerdemannia flammicorona TaxID=994334 RepID=A0A433QH26_9FUNG|nr:3-beta hydroxysteroid dehydrogenase/isomerase family-domain-containing protein [Jimgerdemannia flammicorona]
MPDHYLVIGGEGFLGRHVVEQIRARNDGSTIAVFDIIQRTNEKDVRYFKGDLREYDVVYAALDGITAVIHTASPPHVSGPNPPRDLYFGINVKGTGNVIKACQERGITKLVVTSSGSVISTGKAMVNVDESAPYPPVAIDVYTESKIEGEKLVLAANNQRGLLTCTIRPSGIFGPGDSQIIPGFLEVCERGQHIIQIGDNTGLMDFTYVGNVAYAHVLAVEQLTSPTSPAAGQAFNITNGTPIPFWDIAMRVWKEVGYHIPKSRKIVLPYALAVVIAYISETIYETKALFIDRSKLKEGLSRGRIKQVISSRYFNIDKAKSILGYEPRVGLEEGIVLSIQYIKDQKAAAAAKKTE